MRTGYENKKLTVINYSKSPKDYHVKNTSGRNLQNLSLYIYCGEKQYMNDTFKKSDPSHGNNVPLSPILQKLCFPESPSFLVHLILFPYRFLFINVGSNHLLHFLLNPKKSFVDYFSVIAFGVVYFFIIWGGMFGLAGLFLAAALFRGSSLETGFGLIGLPFMILGMILGVYVLKIRYNFYKT